MGIVNATPDSFSDGGQYLGAAGVEHGLRLAREGATILDVGGESTRPGAPPVSPAEQIRRVVPVIEGLRAELPDHAISIDTRSALVARAAIQAGATAINDVSGLADPLLAPLAAQTRVKLYLMHTRGTPETMQENTDYRDLVGEVVAGLRQLVERATFVGVARDQIIVDPGVGFGKALLDNPRLIGASGRIAAELNLPVLIGASRKRFIGAMNGVDTAAERMPGSLGAALAAAAAGASVVRVHDVDATVRALRIFEACLH